ncbi:Nn.00g118120.m01.CDS01 [Neocucurbitaria sp. VM-36]
MAQQDHLREHDHFLQPPYDGRVYLHEPEGSQSSVLPLIDTQGSLQSRRNGLSIGIFLTSLYSTLLSGLFVVVAILQPQYGFIISKRGSFSPSSATLLTTFMAKTIELSFVMVVLVFLGQTLSRKAIRQQGISLANVTMRSWILQPGTLFTQWYSVRYAAFSLLGFLSIFAAILSLLYTTAAGALVQPQLRLAPRQQMTFGAEVHTDFANVSVAEQICDGEWLDVNDAEFGGSTCLQVKWAYLCGANFVNYMSTWSEKSLITNPSSSTHLDDHPPVFATLDNNITVTTAWVDVQDIKTESDQGRIVNNITIAVPHRGVPDAARTNKNVLQLDDLSNAGFYTIEAKVASPALNALCVNANTSDLEPIIYATWPNARKFENISDINRFWPIESFQDSNINMNNQTALDSVFGWKDENEDRDHARPVFLKFPLAGNTIANHSSTASGRAEIYLLGKHPENQIDDYFICSLKTGITSSCFTRYNASSSGQTLEALCDDGVQPDAANDVDFKVSPEWREIGFHLLNSLSLNNGVFDGAASTARIFTQLQLVQRELSAKLPSPAEALLSMATCTVLDLTRNFPFQPFSDDNRPEIDKARLQSFNASVQVAQYMSGSDNRFQRIFLAVLLLTFAINLFIFIYLGIMLRIRLITDLCEPLVLFLLGYHSNTTHLFRGLPQEGPHPHDYAVPWVVKRRNGQLVVVGKEEADLANGRNTKRSFQMKSRKGFVGIPGQDQGQS